MFKTIMISFLYSHFQLCFTTLAFLSWIPVPRSSVTNQNLDKMGMYFPIVGACLGGISAFTLFFTSHWFPYPVAVALTWFVYGWITGAFHDDGLADLADSMGGYEPQKRLEIMHDSRIGTYGSFALISSYVLRYAALSSVNPDMAIRNLIAYSMVARVAAVFFLTRTQISDFLPDSLSRTIPFSGQWAVFFIGSVYTVLITIGVHPTNIILIPIVIFIPPIFMRRYCLKKLGYITGDCAGFLTHITETFLHVFSTVL